MKIVKKFLAGLAFALLFWGNGVFADGKIDELHLFTAPGCPHCVHAKTFFEEFKQENKLDLTVNNHDIGQNTALAEEFYQRYSVPSSQRGLVPAIFIGDRYFIGFGAQIEQEIADYLLDGEENNGNLLDLPIFGKIDPNDFSLPALAVILGIADGFNVCSLGALIVILGMVMIFRSRQKIILLGGTFILVTAIIYGLLVFAWHQIFSLITPYVRSMEMLIGVLAFAGGIYLLKEFQKARQSGPVCQSNNLMSRLTPKIQKIFQKKSGMPIMLGAVALFAVAVTIIEFPCSAFLPVLFAGILVETGTPLSLSILYIGIYIFLYLLDEFVIFAVAVATLKIKIVSPRFIIFFNLAAALVFILLGVYYLFGRALM